MIAAIGCGWSRAPATASSSEEAGAALSRRRSAACRAASIAALATAAASLDLRGRRDGGDAFGRGREENAALVGAVHRRGPPRRTAAEAPPDVQPPAPAARPPH